LESGKEAEFLKWCDVAFRGYVSIPALCSGFLVRTDDGDRAVFPGDWLYREGGKLYYVSGKLHRMIMNDIQESGYYFPEHGMTWYNTKEG